ncbi:MAG: flagellar synthesis regulator FleN [Desulfobacca sp.]|nr:flagellar synthesis regulator FleN [Desulfobacca sp.]
MMRAKSPVVTSVSSGKGGVGKTFLAINLATCLARMGKKVLMVDCDLGLANIDIMLGLNPTHTLKDIAFGDMTAKEVVLNTQGGFDLMPASSGVKEMAQLFFENIDRIKTAVKKIAMEYDHIILDTGAGISETVLQFNLIADRNIVVLNRELTSLTDAYSTIKVIFQMFEKNSFDLIINSARNADEALKIFDHIDSISKRFLGFSLNYLGYVSYDEIVPRSIMKQTILALAFPQSPPAVQCAAIARKIAGDL